MMYKVEMKNAYCTAIAHVALSFLTAPLLTLVTSIQASSVLNRVTLNEITQAGLRSGKDANRSEFIEQKSGNKFLEINYKDKAETVR